MEFNDPSRVVKFYLGIGYVGAEHRESQTLGDLFDPEDLADMDKEELEKALSEAQEDWASNYLDSSWYFEDEE